jgi:hypothetical protein
MKSNPRLYLLVKAGADQESGGRTTMPSGGQAKREDEHSYSRQPEGESGDPTADTAEERWHGSGTETDEDDPHKDDNEQTGEERDVQKVWSNPQVPFQQKDVAEAPAEAPGDAPGAAPGVIPGQQQAPPGEQASVVKSLMAQAMKAFAGAPRFAQGPLVPPREKEWLKTQGYSPDEIDSGQVQITSRMRGEFNRWLQGTIRKSLGGLMRG